MVSQTPTSLPLLVQLLGLIDQLPVPAAAARRGRPCVYSERVFVKAVVVMVVRHLPTVHALLAVLEQPDMAPCAPHCWRASTAGACPTPC